MVVSYFELCGRTEKRSGCREVTGQFVQFQSLGWVMVMALNDFRNAEVGERKENIFGTCLINILKILCMQTFEE